MSSSYSKFFLKTTNKLKNLSYSVQLKVNYSLLLAQYLRFVNTYVSYFTCFSYANTFMWKSINTLLFTYVHMYNLSLLLLKKNYTNSNKFDVIKLKNAFFSSIKLL